MNTSSQPEANPVLTTYTEVETALRDERLTPWKPIQAVVADEQATRRQGDVSAKFLQLRQRNLDTLSLWLGERHPPAHTWLRKLLSPPFSLANVTALVPSIQATADALIDRAQAAGEMDLVDYAMRLPLLVISDILGVPHQDSERLRRWSVDMSPLVHANSSAPQRERSLHRLWASRQYFEKLVMQRRAQPRDDFISALIATQAQTHLRDDELVANATDLFFAAQVTTGPFIHRAARTLLTRPDDWELLQHHPQFMPKAIEELLRVASPAHLCFRQAKEDMELYGRSLKQGQTITLSLRSANYDPQQFHTPDQLDLLRSPNHHLAFGAGIHYCLGAHLVRAEAQVALSTLFRRVPREKLIHTNLEEKPRV